MQLDRLVSRTVSNTMSQIVKSGLKNGIAGLRAKREDAPVPKTPKDDLRGSGSWANEWTGTRSAVETAKALAKKGKAPKPDAPATPKTPAADAITEGSVRPRPLMSTRDVKLHNWIADRMEAEAPTCSLHAGVALSAFLASDEAYPGFDPLSGMIADMLIADGEGQPVLALIRENTADPARHLLLLDALLDADLPIVDIQPRPKLSALWDEITQHLPEEV
ncbi:MAG: hypothetical protein AAF366_01640 [Pseudomonadota bacterium]